MSAVNLLTPILNGGIQNVNFVNGRVLTAEDLTAERSANLQRQRLMGNCIGDGVAGGYEVTLSSKSVAYGQQVVHITAGVAINRSGDVLQLATDTDVVLAATLPTAPNNGGLFAVCQPPVAELSNPGIYVLTVLPASGYQGQAPVTQLGSNGVATSCSSRFATAGVQFRLSPVTLAGSGSGLQPTLYALANQIQTLLNTSAPTDTVAPLLSQLRNGLAHACFGTGQAAALAADPLTALDQSTPPEAFGIVEDQRASGLLTNCEVPLAIVYWSLQGIQFVDMWSVRRTLAAPSPATDWAPELSGRRQADGLAVLLQFQSQMEYLAASLGSDLLLSFQAANYFLFLPPAGLIVQSGFGPNGFVPAQFFGGRQIRGPYFIEGVRLRPLLLDSLRYTPIDLVNDKQMMWLYVIRENSQAVAANVTGAPRAAMVFTSGYVPYRAEPQFDLSHFNNANFAFVPAPAP